MHRGKFIKFPQELSFHRISPPSPVLWSVGIYIFEIAGKEALTYWHKFIDISVLVVDHTGNLAKQSRGRRREGTRRNLDAFQPPSPQRKPVDELNNIIVTVTLAAFETQFILACYSRSRQFGSPAPLHYSNRAFVVVGSSTRIPNNTSSYYIHDFDLKLRDRLIRLISPNINSSTSLSVDPHESMISLKFVSQERAFSDEPRIYRTISRKFFLLLLFVKKSKNQFINHKRITRGRRHGNLKVKISLLLLCSSLRKFLLETFRRESWKRTRRH